MRSRLLIGACGWLLGAATATCGSMLAVNHLAHGLLGPAGQQLSPAAVRQDLASTRPAASSLPLTSSGPETSEPPATRSRTRPQPPSARPAASPVQPPAPDPASTGAGTLLVSKGGSVMAACQSGGAYLQYWSPAQGYEADDVARGPAAQARLTFEGTAGNVLMTVTCSGGQPTDNLYNGPGNDGPHDH